VSNQIPDDLYAEIHEHMPILCVDVVVGYNNKILLIKRTREPALGQWWLPGGRVVKGEDIKQAAIRLVKDETGILIKYPILLGYDQTKFDADPFGHGKGTHTVNFVFCAKAPEMSMLSVALDNNHSDHGFFDYETIYSGQMHPYVRKFTILAEDHLK
jgi:colanic acid biosynthesis protein WcaH